MEVLLLARPLPSLAGSPSNVTVVLQIVVPVIPVMKVNIYKRRQVMNVDLNECLAPLFLPLFTPCFFFFLFPSSFFLHFLYLSTYFTNHYFYVCISTTGTNRLNFISMIYTQSR